MAQIEIDVLPKGEQQTELSQPAAQPVSNQNGGAPLSPQNESNDKTNSENVPSSSTVEDSKKEAANDQAQNSTGGVAAHSGRERIRRPAELANGRSRPAAQNAAKTTQPSKRRTHSAPRHAANRMVQSACEHASKTSRAQGTKALRREPTKLTRSQSNIDRLAKPRGETRVRPSHKCCMIAIDAFEVFRDPFNYRRARSASRTPANTQKRHKRSLSSKCNVCCEHCAPVKWYHCVQHCKRAMPVHHCCAHCDASACPDSHCAKTTCAHKVAHFCCAHCSTVHCNDASCQCEKHAHRCCVHCDAAKRLHCAAATCGHSRVHNCCAHCATTHMVPSVTCDSTETAAPHCTRRECLARFATVHRCCSHCDASANLHCVVRTCVRIPQLRHVNTNAATQKSTNGNARQHNSHSEKAQSSNAHLRKLTNPPKQRPSDKPGDKPSDKLDGSSSSKNVERKRPVAQNAHAAHTNASTVNKLTPAPKKPTEPSSTSQRPRTASRSAKRTEAPPSPQKKKPPVQASKIPAAKPSAMTKSMIVQPTTTAKASKKPDRMVTSTSALALKKKPQEQQPVKVVRVNRPAAKATAPASTNAATEQRTSLNQVAVGDKEKQQPDAHSAIPDVAGDVTSGSPDQQPALESPKAVTSDSETPATKQHEIVASKEVESEQSKLEKAALTKFHEERIERKKRVDTILRSRVKGGSQRGDSVCVEDASADTSLHAKSADEKADSHLQQTPSSETGAKTHKLQACSESVPGEGNEDAGGAFQNGTTFQSATRTTHTDANDSQAHTQEHGVAANAAQLERTERTTAETGPLGAETQHVRADEHTLAPESDQCTSANATHVPLPAPLSHESSAPTHSATDDRLSEAVTFTHESAKPPHTATLGTAQPTSMTQDSVTGSTSATSATHANQLHDAIASVPNHHGTENGSGSELDAHSSSKQHFAQPNQLPMSSEAHVASDSLKQLEPSGLKEHSTVEAREADDSF